MRLGKEEGRRPKGKRGEGQRGVIAFDFEIQSNSFASEFPKLKSPNFRQF